MVGIAGYQSYRDKGQREASKTQCEPSSLPAAITPLPMSKPVASHAGSQGPRKGRAGSWVSIPAVADLAVVEMVTVTGTAVEPLMFARVGLKTHVATAGSPEQVNDMVPENPSAPVTARL